jgi:hypothetical protein
MIEIIIIILSDKKWDHLRENAIMPSFGFERGNFKRRDMHIILL